MANDLEVRVVATPQQAAGLAVAELLQQLRDEPAGLISFATGKTYAPFFQALTPVLTAPIQATHLDEFIGLEAKRAAGMATEILRACPPLERAALEGRFIPVPGTDDPAQLAAHEAKLAAAGGVALQFLGLGRNGHLAFNEPGVSTELGFHVAELTPQTRADLAERFRGCAAGVPTHAATAGLGSILKSRRIVLLATGAAKAPAVKALRSGEVSLAMPASCLHAHAHVTVILDEAAAL